MADLYLKLEPLDEPPARGGTYLVADIEHGGNGRYCHHAHPDRTLRDAVAGDVLVHQRRRYRMLAVQRFRSDMTAPWFGSVAECLAWIVEAERENREFHARWWAEHAASVR